jgi:hypothetical protein
MLVRETQADSAGDEDFQQRTRREESGDDSRCLDHLLEIVEHEQRSLVAQDSLESTDQWRASRFRHPKRLGDHRRDEGWIADRGKLDKDEAVLKVIGHGVRCVQGEAGLPDAARAGERQEWNILATQQVANLRELTLPPDQRRAR